jgi:tetratricopeptide (TPR) repeat protein
MQGKRLALASLLIFALSATAKDSEKVTSPPPTALPVLKLKSQIQVQLDGVLNRFNYREFVYLATLDPAGKPINLLLLEGNTLFVSETSDALRKQSFDPKYANHQVIIAGSVAPDPAPLRGTPVVIVLQNPEHPTPADEEILKAEREHESQVEPCTPSMDKDDLVRHGFHYESRNRVEAFRCFEIALSKRPDSIAALDGASRTCGQEREVDCRRSYLVQIAALRPDFYEARERLALAHHTPEEQDLVVADLRKLLAEDPAPPVQCAILNQLIFVAQRAGDIQNEVIYRTQASEIMRKYFALYPSKFGLYSRIEIVFNDDSLALLLEGTHQWADAEVIYRRNIAMSDVDPLFEKEEKFDNQLGLARTLVAQGKDKDAAHMCSKWKIPARFVANGGEVSVGLENAPVEIAKWDVSCGNEQEGLARLQKEAAAHPSDRAAYIALRDYYYAHGDVKNALKAEEHNDLASGDTRP